ncbi:MAG: Nodulation efficiency protein NfeD [Acidobacteriales bacterium]|nr:Nodulation efficiency protein NfeD [Terriglobales bacterium]
MSSRRYAAIAICLLLVCGSASADVLKIVVNDTINPITAEYISRAIDQAKTEKADAVLIELRTPGGLLDSTRTIIEKILTSEVPVIVYVTPSGGYAASAGFFILESADIAAMAPGTNTGAAHPVLSGGIKVDDVMKQKMENDAAALMRSYSGKRGRNVEIAESAVLQSKSFTEQEALDKKLIDVIAPDDRDLLNKLDGRTVSRFDGKTLTLHLAGKTIRFYEMTLKQQILGFLMDPNIAYILFSIGMLALYAEFNNPGAVVPGVVGLIFILLAIFAFNLLPTRFAALALIVAAFIMFGLEVKFASHGVLGLGGTVMMVIGALLLVDGPIPQMRVRLLTALSVSIPIALITIFLMSIAYKARLNKVTTGEEGMIGQIGTAQTLLAPAGKVFVHGETWNAVCPEHASIGERVQVKEVRGLQLEVARVKQQQS